MKTDGKVDKMQDYIDSFSTERESIRKNEMEMLEIKSSLTKKKNAFDLAHW